MTTPASVGDLPLSLFDVVDDFVVTVAGNTVSDRDRSPHGSHPLVVLVESTLEAITRTMKPPIVGLSRRTDADLVKARRRLERTGKREALQRLLFSFEQIAPGVRDAGYGGRSPRKATEFFTELFPDWLERLADWADEESNAGLAARVRSAFEAYFMIARDVAFMDDDDDENDA